MHSSRMRTVRCSGRLWGWVVGGDCVEGVVCPEGVSASVCVCVCVCVNMGVKTLPFRNCCTVTVANGKKQRDPGRNVTF